jgi:hypothetical protein
MAEDEPVHGKCDLGSNTEDDEDEADLEWVLFRAQLQRKK